jgi:hypothetical protein
VLLLLLPFCAGMAVYDSREVQDQQIARIIGKVGQILQTTIKCLD